MRGAGSPTAIFDDKLSKMADALKQMDRKKIFKLVDEMSEDGAVADKALEKLCEDASNNEVKIDAPPRRKNAIKELLERIEYQEKRSQYLYKMISSGDLFLQLEWAIPSSPLKLAYIEDIMLMPVDTMLRNTDDTDHFTSLSQAFAQVEDIANGFMALNLEWFPWIKIVHGRNDPHKSKFFGYGRSGWISGLRVFNIAMMLLEDSAIARHENSTAIRKHQVGVNAQTRVNQSVINEYKSKFEQQMTNRTTDVYIGGTNDFKYEGGTQNIMTNVDDIMFAFSILSIAVDYPIDLLSGMIKKTASGEELFRKEIIVKRAVKSIIKKENEQILKPLIDRELLLSGSFGDYRITTYPSSFEDDSKRSKRGLGEMAAFVKAPSTFHLENNTEIPWEEEQGRIEIDLAWMQKMLEKYPDAASVLSGSVGMKDPEAGNQGDSKSQEDQEERTTTPARGEDNDGDKTGGE
jgi:hypothetical protein